MKLDFFIEIELNKFTLMQWNTTDNIDSFIKFDLFVEIKLLTKNNIDSLIKFDSFIEIELQKFALIS